VSELCEFSLPFGLKERDHFIGALSRHLLMFVCDDIIACVQQASS